MSEERRVITRAQPTDSGNKTPFPLGAFPDSDPSMLPIGAVHVIKDYRCHAQRGLVARGGSQLSHSNVMPSLPGRTGYSLTKSGTTVTKTVGTNFSASDVGNYVVYDDGYHERIQAYINVNQVTVAKSTVHAASTAAYIRGPKNARIFHEKKRIHILSIDTRLFYCSSTPVTGWTEIHKSGISAEPVAEESTLEAYDDYATLKNAGGLYKIDLVNFLYWRMNSAIPSVRVTDVAESTDKPYGRNILYSCGRLSGTGQTRDRYTSGVEIQQETGTVEVDASGKDYGQVFTERPVGEGDTTYGRKCCAIIGASYDTPAEWEAVSDGQFTISIDGVSRNVKCTFTGVTSMSEVAERIQTGLRDSFENATCTWEADATRFVIESPVEGGTVSHLSSGTGGTDIAEAMMGRSEDGGVIENPLYTAPVIYGNLEMPVDTSNDLYDSHLNFYSIYSTLTIGKNGKHPTSGEFNNDQLLVWQKDIVAAKAFMASVSGYDITITEGTLEKCDEGCMLRFQNGTEVLIYVFLTATTAVAYEDAGVINSQPAAIGGDYSLGKAIRVMTASQAGQTVTRTSGDTFSGNDVGRIIFWPDGYESHVIAYVDANTVTVNEDAVIASTGCCIEPKTRKYTDVIRDEPTVAYPNLRSRIQSYSLQNRFFTPMPAGAIGKNTASLFTVAAPGDNIIYYCAADVNYRFQAGYHYASKQREIFQDVIHSITECQDTLSIKCSGSTRAVPINQFGSYVVDKAGTAIILLTGQKMVDEKIGVKHHGGVCVVDRGLQYVITSEPAFRSFDGNSYGENLADERIQKIIEGCQAAYAMAYSPIDGIHIWMLEA
jgi:hypothetical protein